MDATASGAAIAAVMTSVPPIPLWLLIGLPGSGKSTWATYFCQRNPPLQLISTDKIRGELFGDEAIQGPWLSVWAEVTRCFQLAVQQTQTGTVLGTVYDATNAQRKGRRVVIQAARAAGFNRILAVWFDIPTAICLHRNQQRSRQVPVEVIEAMARQLAGASPHVDEGFDALYRVRT